jgi:putative transferase (TIGR04331 family)
MSSDYKTLLICKDEPAFQQSEPVLLLGKWCSVDCPAESIIPDIEYVYNPLSDNDEREKHYYYIQKVANRLMLRVAEKLNIYHKAAFSNKEWRMLLGNYILLLSHTSYIQWLLLQSAFKSNNISQIRVPIFKNHDCFVPRDFIHFGSLLSHNNFYIFLIKEIILGSDFNVNIEECEIDFIDRSIYPSKTEPLKRCLYKAANIIGKYSFKYGSNHKILFFQSYLNKKFEAKLNLKLGQIPFIHPFEELNIKESPDHGLRAKLKSNDYNGFEKILYEILWQFLPICFLEGFSSTFRQISEQTKNFNPKLIVTSNVGIMQNYPFLFYLLSKKEKRPKVISLQHGGRYGTAKYNCVEEYEIDACDYFFSWGWQTKDKVIPSVMNKGLGKKIKKRKVGSYLIYMPYKTARIPKRITTSISVTGIAKQFERDKIFFQNIDPKIKKMMRIRFHFQDRQSINAYSDLISNFHESKKTYLQDNNRARIVTSTVCSTTILESLAYNIPTVSFFDRDSDRLNTHASKYFNMLADVGILHYDPISASNFINSIWDDVETWWHSEEVKKVKRKFVKEFANFSKDSEDKFIYQLLRLYKA